jgi:hypothetical protein
MYTLSKSRMYMCNVTSNGNYLIIQEKICFSFLGLVDNIQI